jgi:hypothetical protein
MSNLLTKANKEELIALGTVDYAKAKEMSEKFHLPNMRSVVAFCSNANTSINYIGSPKAKRKKPATSKAAMVEAICKGLSIESCEGLEKATGLALNKLLQNIA